MEKKTVQGPAFYLVRHELDELNFARVTGAFGPAEEARYQLLCDLERKMLRFQSVLATTAA